MACAYNGEFRLAELASFELHQYQLKKIQNARTISLPKPKMLEKLRDRAGHKDIDICTVDENELAMAFESHSGLFKLEHGPTTEVVGGVWHHLGGAYRLLWLIDGRTIEVIHPRYSENAFLFADGIEIGSYKVVEKRRFWFCFKAPCVWAICIGDEEVIRLDQQRRFQTRIRIRLSGQQPIETWIGIAKLATLDDHIFRFLHKLRIRRSVPANMRWFLPRDESGHPIACTTAERIALTTFAMLKRQPGDADHSAGSSGSASF